MRAAAREGLQSSGATTTTTGGSRNGRGEARNFTIFFFWVILIFASTSNLVVSASRTSTSHGDELGGGRFMRSPPRKSRFLGKVSFYAPSSTSSHDVHHLWGLTVVRTSYMEMTREKFIQVQIPFTTN
ncbi:hypothetical protein Pyn_25110 [Prunus yedoensis var. nudiflora]|uniref:Uncharacterized protein n=1 Tax=Prunus yedoensis var. nudiflora TaxID=2094558 RepID=A0A314ZNF3_PRUYE|nr:hypothetical protein Pyn_25110 [Prunus yedoensis var. nudiflora]